MMKNKMILVWTILALCAALCGCGGRAVVQDELPVLEETVTQEEPVASIELPDEEDEMLSPDESIPAVEEAPVVDIPRQEDGVAVLESEAVPVDTICQESPHTVDYYYDLTVEEVEAMEDVDSFLSEIPSMTVPPKTDYESTAAELTPVLEVVPVWEVAPSPEPVVVATADLDVVMAAANAYVASTYGCVIDPTIDMSNSSYRFPAYASTDADQATVEAKARDIVEYTFRQLMQQNGVTLERLAEAGVRCNVYAYRDGDSIFLYCLYA